MLNKSMLESFAAPCPKQGKLELVHYTSRAYALEAIFGESPITMEKSMWVYTPYGYDPSKKYNVLFLMHGGTDNEGYWSLSVFGPIREKNYTPITEEDTPMPNTAYGLSKLKAEIYLQSIPGFPYVIYRPTGVYGPREKDYFLMAKSIRQHTDFSVGFRRQELTCVYVKDIVQAVFLGIEKQVSCRTYFLADGKVYRSRAFSDLIRKELGNPFVIRLRCPLIILKVVSLLAEYWAKRRNTTSTLNSDKYRIMKQRNWQCDITPAVKELGYSPEYDLERGVKETIAWYKDKGWL